MKTMAILATFFVLIMLSAGCFDSGERAVKVGFVNMNEAGLDEIGNQLSDYGKKLAEDKGFAVLQKELKQAEEAARNTPEAVELKEKIKPLLEAWENAEKVRGSGNADEIKAAESKFQDLMSDKELTGVYTKYHGIVDSNPGVIAERKEIMAISKEISVEINNKKTKLTEELYRKIKIVSSEMVQGKYSIILGITEFSPGGKKIMKKIEILHCDKSSTEDLTEMLKMRLKFFK